MVKGIAAPSDASLAGRAFRNNYLFVYSLQVRRFRRASARHVAQWPVIVCYAAAVPKG
jgi:hypothetical protein